MGQPIAAILAVTRELARKASYMVHVEYEDLPAILTIEVMTLSSRLLKSCRKK